MTVMFGSAGYDAARDRDGHRCLSHVWPRWSLSRATWTSGHRAGTRASCAMVRSRSRALGNFALATGELAPTASARGATPPRAQGAGLSRYAARDRGTTTAVVLPSCAILTRAFFALRAVIRLCKLRVNGLRADS